MKYIPYIIIAVLVGVILIGNREVDTVEIHTTDTVFVSRIDTFFEEKPVVRYKNITDTIYIEKDGVKIELPIESKHYSKDASYDVWISGYNANMDSIRTYNKIEYRTITNNIEKIKLRDEWNIYGECGFYSITGHYSPFLGISITSPKKFKIGANIGYFNNDFSYGVNIGLKLW